MGNDGNEGWDDGDISHGDRRYVAPEVLEGKGSAGGEDGGKSAESWCAADVFSLGASLYGEKCFSPSLSLSHMEFLGILTRNSSLEFLPSLSLSLFPCVFNVSSS